MTSFQPKREKTSGRPSHQGNCVIVVILCESSSIHRESLRCWHRRKPLGEAGSSSDVSVFIHDALRLSWIECAVSLRPICLIMTEKEESHGITWWYISLTTVVRWKKSTVQSSASWELVSLVSRMRAAYAVFPGLPQAVASRPASPRWRTFTLANFSECYVPVYVLIITFSSNSKYFIFFYFLLFLFYSFCCNSLTYIKEEFAL